MEKILICDDDRDIVAALKIYLNAEGYQTVTAANGRQALEVMEREPVQLVLLDVMMPELDGIAATARLREKWNVPIILLTAKSEDSDKVLGLNIGADDYVTKPFNPVELVARVRSQLRRYTRLGAAPAPAPTRYTAGGVELDDAEKTVLVDSEPVSLTPTEYAILKLLIGSPGRVFSSREICERVWAEAALGSESSVAVHIRHLREKIEIDPGHPRHLTVVWGRGYKLEKGAEQ